MVLSRKMRSELPLVLNLGRTLVPVRCRLGPLLHEMASLLFLKFPGEGHRFAVLGHGLVVKQSLLVE